MAALPAPHTAAAAAALAAAQSPAVHAAAAAAAAEAAAETTADTAGQAAGRQQRCETCRCWLPQSAALSLHPLVRNTEVRQRISCPRYTWV